MAMTDDYLVVCPFYKVGRMTNNIYHIACEPPVGADTIRLGFYGPKLNTWRAKYCRNIHGYKECPVAKMLLEKYDTR